MREGCYDACAVSGVARGGAFCQRAKWTENGLHTDTVVLTGPWRVAWAVGWFLVDYLLADTDGSKAEKPEEGEEAEPGAEEHMGPVAQPLECGGVSNHSAQRSRASRTWKQHAI